MAEIWDDSCYVLKNYFKKTLTTSTFIRILTRNRLRGSKNANQCITEAVTRR